MDNLGITFDRYACEPLQSPSPGGRGEEDFSAFAFDVVGDFVDLVKDIPVAIYEVADLGRCVHDG